MRIKRTTSCKMRWFFYEICFLIVLYNDVPMGSVSKLLGHSSMKITEDSYGKIVEKKISLEMERLRRS